MGVEELLKEIREEVKKEIPATVEVTDIEFEAAVLVIYTKHPERFAEDEDLVRRLAKKLRKRVVVRPDPSVLASVDKSDKTIRDLVPAEAEITELYFEPDIGEVIIEARKPGLVIGRHGTTLNDITKAIGWAPKVIRTPPIPSKNVKEIRQYLRTIADERKEILHRVGRRIYRGGVKEEQWVRWTSLGGYREVGRSCHLLQTQDTKILIDCGVNFANDDKATPYLHLGEVWPLTQLDAVILTHAHMDHCGLIPLLYKYGYDGPVYLTAPTRDLAVLLCMDYIKIAAAEGKKPPYESDHIRDFVKHSVTLEFGDTTDIAPDVKLTFSNSGHILGSAVSHFHIGDGFYNVCCTSDMKYERTWLFNPTNNKFPRLETLIMEATYGGRNDFQPTRQQAQDQMKEICQRVLPRGGKLVVPCFAVGRSQEIMLVMEELIRNGDVPRVPVYLDGMIWEATAIHTAYPEYLNNELRNEIFHEGSNPLLSDIFIRVDSQEMRRKVLDATEPCVVLATSGMMSGGPVMEYFRHWAQDKRNALVFVGFQAGGTLGRRIQQGWREIPMSAERGRSGVVKVEMDVETVDGFSGHSDRRQLMNYINNITPKPDHVITMHGEESKCIDLATSIHKKYHMRTEAPMNLETIRLK
ncbi:MAG TPA: beta-CASP ribonuclease aCPSF1 [Candidatus Thermoplasmatota archaeon]|nr:beta-CASP ribonuclease aCPSF1 [Candidatus Thermoplasmatota archaeon]